MFSIKFVESSDDVESLVNTLNIEGSTLTESNISLTTTDLQRLAELSQELNFNNSMETEGDSKSKHFHSYEYISIILVTNLFKNFQKLR